MFGQRRAAPVFKPLPTGPAMAPAAPAEPRAPATVSHLDAPAAAPLDDEPADASAAPEPLPEDIAPQPAVERRLHIRVPVDLTGRFMTPEREEHPCRAIDMSPGGVALKAETVPDEGARIVAYLDHVGRIEGEVVRSLEDGFAMTVKATPRRRDKLAAQLTYLANREALSLPEDRRHERIPLSETRTALTLVNGTAMAIDIIDASISGVAVATDKRPEVGTPCFVGAVRGRVVRHVEGGLAIEFAQVQDAELLEAALILDRPKL